MASSRSKNTLGNYTLEQQAVAASAAYSIDRDFAYPQRVLLAGTGLVQGYMGNAVLAQNPQDVESFLFGIGSANLVQPAHVPFQAHIRQLPAWTIHDEKKLIVMPEPLALPESRPFPLPSDALVVRN